MKYGNNIAVKKRGEGRPSPLIVSLTSPTLSCYLPSKCLRVR